MAEPHKLEVQVRPATEHLWVATAPAVRVSETGETYESAMDRLKRTLERVLDYDVVLDVTVYDLED